MFFDVTGRRWRRILVWLGIALLAAVAAIAVMTPPALQPLWTVPHHQSGGYPAQFPGESDLRTIPILGDENTNELARIDRVRRQAGVTYLLDSLSGRVLARK